MKLNKTFCSLLLLSAVTITVPLTAKVISKQSNRDKININAKKRLGVSPIKHDVPPITAQAPALASASAPASTPTSPRLRGLVVNAKGNHQYIGEMTFDETGVKLSKVYDDADFDASGCAFYGDGKFYTQYIYEESIGSRFTAQVIYDATTWEVLEERDDLLPSSSAICMTYDPVDCTAYGYFHNDDGTDLWFGFGNMNLATGETYQYNSVDSKDAFMCIAASPDGYIYGVDAYGQYCRIDKPTGAITVLGHTDVKPYYIQSAVIDRSTGVFYWAAMTDNGESWLYTVDPQTYLAKPIGKIPGNAEFVGLYVYEEPNPASTPAPVTDIQTSFIKDNLSGTVSFDIPEQTVTGTPLSGKLKAHVSLAGKHFEADATAGNRCSVNVTVPVNDLYIFTAWVSADDNQGEKTTTQKWIGADYPLDVNDLMLTNDKGHITLTWSPPSERGLHGGYVDQESVTYVIGREGGGFWPSLREYKGTKFEDDLPAGMSAKISYYVRPVYNELVGPVCYSNEVVIGNDLKVVPFSMNAANVGDCVVIDGNNDGVTWEGSWGYAKCDTPKGGADDWLLTPYLALKAGEIYELLYEVSAKMGFLEPQTIEVKTGKGDSADAMTIDIDTRSVEVLNLNRPDEVKATFTVPSDGNYRIGFHNASPTSGTLGLSAIKVNMLGASAGPIAPGNCKVEAAPLGELKATISFKAPSVDSEGNTFTELSRIDVYKGKTIVGTVDNPKPGETYSVVDGKYAEQGKNTYEIAAVSVKGATGIKASASGWVGIDIPELPYDVTLKEDNGVLSLTWKLPATGIHNGYVDPRTVEYFIFDPMYMVSLGAVTGSDHLDIEFGKLNSQTIIQLAVGVRNSAGENEEATLTPAIAVGPPYELPFFETFPGGKVNYSWTVVGDIEDEEAGWSPVSDKGPDGSAGVSTYWGMSKEEESAIRSRRISLIGAKEPTLRFYSIANHGDENDRGTFKVMISEEFDGPYTTLYEQKTEEHLNNWETHEISLEDYVGKNIFIQFMCTPQKGSILVGIDDISIRNKQDYNISFQQIGIDNNLVEVGVSKSNVIARVQNHGIKDINEGSYSVDFYAGDRKFASLPGKAMGASFGQSTYKTVYDPDMDDNDPSDIWAEVIFDLDEDNSNDKSNSVEINIDKPFCPSVTDLKGEADGEAVILSWTQPDQGGLPIRTVTDDFEAYRNFSVNSAGEWTIIDEDNGTGCNVSYYFPGSNGPMGWVVLKPASIPRIGGGTHADRFPPYSGDTYMVAYNPSSGDNKDWLITPELSGNAQEISFMARAESSKAGREMFEVYYSTTSTKIKDMIRLDDIDWRTTLSGWEEFKFRLPAGAKYFAVRCISHNRCAMHIDDFRYESAPTPLNVVLKGYNVYCNGKKLNPEVINSLSYRDVPTKTKEDLKYTVRAVYDRGEASPSNPYIHNVSSVEMVISDIDPATTPVYDLKGIRIETLIDGEIYVTSGRRFLYKK